MELKRKRGRPRKAVIAQQPQNESFELLKEVVADLRQNQKFQTQMMLEMLRVSQSNSDMVQSWFKMMTPPSGPNTSTSLDQRELPQEDQWEPMRAEDVAKMLGDEEAEYFQQMSK